MRKAAPLLIVLMLLYSLPAQEQIQSNSIGQDRGRFVQDSEYSLSVQNDITILYHQGEPVWKETRTPLEGGYGVSTFYYDDEAELIRIYEHNRLISEELGAEIRYYYYDGEGLLEKTMVLLNDEISEMELYTYDVTSKSLNSILTVTKNGSSISYFGDPIIQPWFSYTKDKVFAKVLQITPNLQIQEVWEGDSLTKSVAVEMLQEGGLRLTTTKKGVVENELYDTEGLLVLRNKPSFTTEYRYNEDRSLKEAIETRADSRVRSIRYEGGREVSETVYMNNTLEKEIFYPLDSGKVETLYDGGLPYCDITYALDGKRVLSIRYR